MAGVEQNSLALIHAQSDFARNAELEKILIVYRNVKCTNLSLILLK